MTTLRSSLIVLATLGLITSITTAFAAPSFVYHPAWPFRTVQRAISTKNCEKSLTEIIQESSQARELWNAYRSSTDSSAEQVLADFLLERGHPLGDFWATKNYATAKSSPHEQNSILNDAFFRLESSPQSILFPEVIIDGVSANHSPNLILSASGAATGVSFFRKAAQFVVAGRMPNYLRLQLQTVSMGAEDTLYLSKFGEIENLLVQEEDFAFRDYYRRYHQDPFHLPTNNSYKNSKIKRLTYVSNLRPPEFSSLDWILNSAHDIPNLNSLALINYGRSQDSRLPGAEVWPNLETLVIHYPNNTPTAQDSSTHQWRLNTELLIAELRESSLFGPNSNIKNLELKFPEIQTLGPYLRAEFDRFAERLAELRKVLHLSLHNATPELLEVIFSFKTLESLALTVEASEFTAELARSIALLPNLKHVRLRLVHIRSALGVPRDSYNVFVRELCQKGIIETLDLESKYTGSRDDSLSGSTLEVLSRTKSLRFLRGKANVSDLETYFKPQSTLEAAYLVGHRSQARRWHPSGSHLHETLGTDHLPWMPAETTNVYYNREEDFELATAHLSEFFFYPLTTNP